MSENQVVFIRSGVKNDILFYDDNLYQYMENTQKWMCTKYKTEACPVYLQTKLLTDSDPPKEEIVRVIGLHSHKNEEGSIINLADCGKSQAKKSTTIRKSNAYKNLTKKSVETDQKAPKAFTRFETDCVYLLCTNNNSRKLVCVNGFLYCLEGKSKTGFTFRWQCIRSDVGCKTRIYTECYEQDQHLLRHISDDTEDCSHVPYTPRYLSNLIAKEKLKIINRGVEKVAEKVIETVATGHANLIPDYSHTLSADPLAPQTNLTVSKSILGKKSFMILPSVKGNRVLCVDNFIFHFDQPSPCNTRAYWTCLLRRDKTYKCKARLVTEENKDGLQIRKMSGTHKHPNHLQKIERRLHLMGLRKDMKKKNTLADTNLIRRSVRKRIVPSKLIDEHIHDGQNVIDEEATKNDDEPDEEDDDIENENENEVENEIKNEEEEEEDCSISSDSFASQTPPHLPERLEDMRMAELIEEDHSTPAENIELAGDDIIEMFQQAPANSNVENIARKRGRKRRISTSSNPCDSTQYEMDISKVSRLRSAKGRSLLCVDDYIYYMKRQQNDKLHWVCIKNRIPNFLCKSFLTTIANPERGAEIKVICVTNGHNHPVSEKDLKRRLCNELVASGAVPKRSLDMRDYYNRSLDEVKTEYARTIGGIELAVSPMKKQRLTMKLYGVSDGPPSLAVRMTFKALNIPFELKNVDYIAGEHMTASYAKMNPQKEIPVLDDNGFFLSESIAIMQYLCDKYAPDNEIYPSEPNARALVNQRLCFNMGFYYSSIAMHAMAPIFFDYPRNEMTEKKVKNALDVFETYLSLNGTKYAANNHVTLADFALVSATLCLEAIGFDLSLWPLVQNWYDTFKAENPSLWEIGNSGMQEIAEFEKNPPDLSHMNHPFHPTRKS